MITCVYVDAGEPKFESEEDELKSVNVTEGDRLRFPCRVTAEPVADIVWLRNGIPLDSEPRCFHALLPSHRDLVVCTGMGTAGIPQNQCVDGWGWV